MRNPHIIVEGLDGAGKGEAINTISRTLSAMGINYSPVREPGGTLLAESIRTEFKKQWKEVVAPETDIMMMYAARQQLYTNVIIPDRDRGVAIVQDRSWMTTFAYQVKGSGLVSTEFFWKFHNLIMEGKPQPDLVIYLDIPPEVGFERIAKARGDNSADRLESYKKEFYEKARAGYLDLATSGTVPNMVVINANRDIDDVTLDIMNAVINAVVK